MFFCTSRLLFACAKLERPETNDWQQIQQSSLGPDWNRKTFCQQTSSEVCYEIQCEVGGKTCHKNAKWGLPLIKLATAGNHKNIVSLTLWWGCFVFSFSHRSRKLCFASRECWVVLWFKTAPALYFQVIFPHYKQSRPTRLKVARGD